MARWTFSDGLTTYVFPVNPSSGGSPRLSKRIFRTTPCNPRPGFVIRMEGQPNAPVGQFSGAVRSQLQYETFVTWWMEKPVIIITDDLGRTYSVVPTALTLTPAGRRRVPWRSTYTFDYVLVSPAVI